MNLRALSLSGASITTMLLYVAGSPFYIVGSITFGDLWVLNLALVLAMLKSTRSSVARLIRSSYGALALSTSLLLLISALNARDILHSLKIVTQFLFILWIVIPLVAAAVADHHDVFTSLRRCVWGYFVFYGIGLVLLFRFNSDVLLTQTGIGRVGQLFTTQVFQNTAMALGIVGFLYSIRLRYVYLGLFLLSLVPILLYSSRTGLLTFMLLCVYAAVRSSNSIRQVLVMLIFGIVSLGFVSSMLDSNLFAEILNVRILSPQDFVEDQPRIEALNSSLDALSRDVGVLLFGAGWGGSGAEIVVHNFVVQTTHEAGIFVFFAILALLGLPVVWAVGTPSDRPMRKQFVVLLMFIFIMFWLFNALSVERPYWLTYALALGVAHGLRIRQAKGLEFKSSSHWD